MLLLELVTDAAGYGLVPLPHNSGYVKTKPNLIGRPTERDSIPPQLLGMAEFHRNHLA